jgi:hypothetical protein
MGRSHATWTRFPDESELNVARQVIEKLIDDLDGSEAVETVLFGLDGTTYEIDLSTNNAAAFRRTLDRYIKASRGSSSPARTSRRKPAASGNGANAKRKFDLAALREWASANNVSVPSRGRIPKAVVDQYKAAGGR